MTRCYSTSTNPSFHGLEKLWSFFFFVLSAIGESHKICPHSLLLNLHKAKLHRSNNVINIYSLAASLTCSNKISKKLKHILLFFWVFPIPRRAKNIQHGVGILPIVVIVCCYLEFKLPYLKILKLFSIRVKELFEPIVLWKKPTGFCSF